MSDLASPADHIENDFTTAESSVYHPKHEQTDQEKLAEQEALASGHQSLRARLLEETVGKAQAVGGVALELAKASNDRIARARGRRRQSKDSKYAFNVHRSVRMYFDTSSDSLSRDGSLDELRLAEETPPYTHGSRRNVTPFGSERDIEIDEPNSAALDTPRLDSAASAFPRSSYEEDGPYSQALRRDRSTGDSLTGQPPNVQVVGHSDLMLDMSGYKMDDGTENDDDGLKTPPNGSLPTRAEMMAADAEQDLLHEADGDILALTRALIRYSEATAQPVNGKRVRALQGLP